MAKARVTRQKAKGLGDTVEQITKATGIYSLVKFVFGEDCGCEERKKKLNELLPYKKSNCLNETDYNYLKELFSTSINVLSINQQRELKGIYLRTFSINIANNNCPSCWRDYVSNLKVVYNSYEQL
jgi:hypothetical protein